VLGITIYGEIGDISRFGRPEKLCAYAGIVPSVRDSAETVHQGRITPRGRGVVRVAAVPGVQVRRWCCPKCDISRLYRRIESERGAGDAMVDGGISPADIDGVVTAGLGSKLGEERETDTIERAFGRRTLDMYAAAVTPNLGYTVGASGAFSAVAAALIVDQRKVPPHATFQEEDIACKLGFTSRVYEDRIVGVATAAYGAHGQNAALILMPHQAEAGDELPILAN